MQSYTCHHEGQIRADDSFKCCCGADGCNMHGGCRLTKRALHWIGTTGQREDGSSYARAFRFILGRRMSQIVLLHDGKPLPEGADAENKTGAALSQPPSDIATRVKCWSGRRKHLGPPGATFNFVLVSIFEVVLEV